MGASIPDFLSDTDPRTLIVYGTVRDPARALTDIVGRAAGPASLTAHYALIGDDVPDLRLCSPGWIEIGPEERLELPNPEDLFLLCREAIGHSASPFSLSVRRFLEAYLDFVSSEVEAARDELDTAVDGEEVFAHKDWLFSAWLPLPHARILLPPAYPGEAPQFAEFDVAFRRRGRIIAVLIDGAGTPVKSVRARRDYALAHHPAIDLVTLEKESLENGTFADTAMRRMFSRFWDGLTLPVGPCPPDIEGL